MRREREQKCPGLSGSTALWWDMSVVCPPDSKNVLVDLVELWDRFREGGDRGNRIWWEMRVICPPVSENVLADRWNSEIDLEKAEIEGTEVSRFVLWSTAFWWDMHVVCPTDSENILADQVELWDGFREGGEKGNRSVKVCTGILLRYASGLSTW